MVANLPQDSSYFVICTPNSYLTNGSSYQILVYMTQAFSSPGANSEILLLLNGMTCAS